MKSDCFNLGDGKEKVKLWWMNLENGKEVKTRANDLRDLRYII